MMKPTMANFRATLAQKVPAGAHINVTSLRKLLDPEEVEWFDSYRGGISNMLAIAARTGPELTKLDVKVTPLNGKRCIQYRYLGADPTPVPAPERLAPPTLPAVKLLQQAMDLIEEALEQMGAENAAQKKLTALAKLLAEWPV